MKKKKGKDKCVSYGGETEYSEDDSLNVRRGYVEGVGQVCGTCCGNLKLEDQS